MGIVLDSMMPAMDGITAARVLRDDGATANIPIIMLTARATDADIWEGYQTGGASSVTKPLDLDVLQAELARISGGHVDTPSWGRSDASRIHSRAVLQLRSRLHDAGAA